MADTQNTTSPGMWNRECCMCGHKWMGRDDDACPACDDGARTVKTTAAPTWNECSHFWAEKADSMFSNEYHSEVRCGICGCPGEMDVKTGEVFWPAT